MTKEKKIMSKGKKEKQKEGGKWNPFVIPFSLNSFFPLGLRVKILKGYR